MYEITKGYKHHTREEKHSNHTMASLWYSYGLNCSIQCKLAKRSRLEVRLMNLLGASYS